MSEIAVHLLKSGAPINALVGVPTITIYRLDTGAAVVTAAVLTDRTAAGLYTYDFTIAIDGINYSFLIDADPTAINQVDTRYWHGTFNTDDLLTRELAEADQFFDESTGLLHFYRKGTTVDLITAKTVTGSNVGNDTTIAQ